MVTDSTKEWRNELLTVTNIKGGKTIANKKAASSESSFKSESLFSSAK